ncbi:MAG: BREX-1 system adenine-specific DNA-methyltransferase PglX, partial [Bacteroidaceae bacterium]|nr:BREX-1 system adenine-specific DNA-methyltransferase PglX [Bacteroidaceae bacterium]
IDPCMGSGHILVYAFDLFCKMYEEEGVYQEKEIPQLILTNNLFGIDIDRRCYQLAAFALTMKARAYYRRYLRKTVTPNVIALQPIDRDTIEYAGAWGNKSSMWQFENIDTIGSLLQITPEECAAIRIESGLFGDRQQLLKTQAEYLSRKYHCVVTNPPYLGKGFGDALKTYLSSLYPDSKLDTMATFMERSLNMCSINGMIGMINMHSWMFISSFEALRIKLLEEYQIINLLHLGPHAFDEIGGEIVQCAAFVFGKYAPNHNGIYYRLVDGKNSFEKELSFLKKENMYSDFPQSFVKSIPGHPIGYWLSKQMLQIFKNPKLSEIAETKLGMSTNDNNRFLRYWYEIDYEDFVSDRTNESTIQYYQRWFPYSKGGGYRKWFGNVVNVINWYEDGKEVKELASQLYGSYTRTCKNSQHFFKSAVTWNLISSSKPVFRYLPNGCVLGDAGPVCFTDKEYFFLGLLNSKVIQTILPIINPTINCSTGIVNLLPVAGIDNLKVDTLSKDNVTISRHDWDAHETSWDFKTNELVLLAKANQTIDEIVREYKAVWTENFMQLHSNEEELNRQFIEIYGLQDELTPDVPLNEVTILQKGEISIEEDEIVWHDDVIIKQLISYLIG